MKKDDANIRPEAAALGAELRNRRGKASIVLAALELRVNKNTVVAYEKGRSLPDVSFLALHAARYGSDFSKLLVMRLEADPDEDVRAMVVEAKLLNPQILDEPTGHLAFGLRVDLMALIIHAIELDEKRRRSRRLTPQMKARFIASLYASFYKQKEVEERRLHQLVSFECNRWYTADAQQEGD